MQKFFVCAMLAHNAQTSMVYLAVNWYIAHSEYEATGMALNDIEQRCPTPQWQNHYINAYEISTYVLSNILEKLKRYGNN